MKVCTKCGIEKPATLEYFSKKCGGLNTRCKTCRADYMRAYRKEDPERSRQQQKDYWSRNRSALIERQRLAYATNAEKRREEKRLDRRKHPDKYKARDREKWQKHRESKREYNRQYYAANKDRLRAEFKKWMSENKESAYQRDRQRKAERLICDPLYAVRRRIKDLIGQSLRRSGYTKRSRTHEILGCDYETLTAHLSAQFQPGMTWENRGEWHIDHIVPLATAKTEEDVIRLNHYTNLQPLWAADNLAKGARLDWAPQPTGEKK